MVSQCPTSLAKMKGYLHLPLNSRLPFTSIGGGGLLARRAVFLDRDGVLVEDVHFLTSPKQLRLLPGVTSALCELQSRFFVIVVTNQSGIARGFLTEEDLMTIHAELVRLLSAEGVTVDALYYCPHLPEAVVPAYGISCICRKPGPGMLLRAAGDWRIDLSQSFLMGDTFRDIEAARRAGVKGIMIGEGCRVVDQNVLVAPNLAAAARLILGDGFPVGEELDRNALAPESLL